jgi:PAS domain S-box-containing protein
MSRGAGPGPQPSIREIIAEACVATLGQLEDVYFFVKDRDRRFIHCNQSLAHLMGFTSPDQIIGKRDEDLSPEHLVNHYRQHDIKVLEEGVKIIDLVELVHQPDDTYDWFSTTKLPIRDSNGEVVAVAGVTRPLSKPDPGSTRLWPLAPAVELIARNYQRRLTVSELADSVAMSVSYFTRSFRKQFGLSPHQYITRVRLAAACELLARTDLPLSAIATRTGFYDQSHLSNALRRGSGVTSTAYRERVQASTRGRGKPDGRVLAVEPRVEPPAVPAVPDGAARRGESFAIAPEASPVPAGRGSRRRQPTTRLPAGEHDAR